MEYVMTISGVSTVVKVYQAGNGQKNAKRSRQGQHHAYPEHGAGGAPATAADPHATATSDADADNERSVGKMVDVTA